MCHYNLKGTIDREQTETTKAKKEFERLIARFPESKFSLAAEKLLRECKQELPVTFQLLRKTVCNFSYVMTNYSLNK